MNSYATRFHCNVRQSFEKDSKMERRNAVETKNQLIPDFQHFGSQDISPNVSQTPSPESDRGESLSPFVRFASKEDIVFPESLPVLLSNPSEIQHKRDEGTMYASLESNFSGTNDTQYSVVVNNIDEFRSPEVSAPALRTVSQSTEKLLDRESALRYPTLQKRQSHSILSNNMKPFVNRTASYRIKNEEEPLWELISFRQRLSYIILWSVAFSSFLCVITSQIGTFIFEVTSTGNAVRSQCTTWNTTKLFWNGNGKVLAVLYFQGAYITPFIQLIISLAVMFIPMYAARRRFILVRQRFLAKLAFLPTFMLLVNLEAFGNHIENVLEAQMYLKPTYYYLVQTIAGPLLILLHTFSINLNRLGPLPRTNLLVSRISLFCSGCSLVCVVGFLCSNVLEIEIIGLLGNLLGSKKMKEICLPRLLLDMPSRYGINTFMKICLTSYFTLMMAVLPVLAIFTECLWRIGAGISADELSLAIDNGIKPSMLHLSGMFKVFGPLHSTMIPHHLCLRYYFNSPFFF